MYKKTIYECECGNRVAIEGDGTPKVPKCCGKDMKKIEELNERS